MSLQHYNTIQQAFIEMQYFSYARQNPQVDLEKYVNDVYVKSELPENFHKSWGWIRSFGLENVIDGE